MNDLIILSLIILLFTRIIGLGTSLNFFYDLRKIYFLYFILGWIFGITGNILAIILDFIEDTILLDLLLVLNALLVSISLILLMIGLFLHFLKINFLYSILSCTIITLIAILLFIFLNYNISIIFSILIMNLTILFALIYPLFNFKKFKTFIAKSIRWYYITCGFVFGYLPISFFLFIQGYKYGLYNTDNILLIILNYTIAIGSHFLFIVLFIHIEYSISSQEKFDLKDKYSHNLGNIMQVIYSASEYIKRTVNLEVEKREKLDLIEIKCKESSKLINEIRKI